MGAIYEDAALYIELNGLGTRVVDMWGGHMPSKPDFMIGVYDHPGGTPEWAMGRRVMDEMTLQIIVRSPNTVTAQVRAFQIYELFSQFNFLPLAQRVIDGVQYHSIMARNPPFPIGQDENNRFRWTCSYRVKRSA